MPWPLASCVGAMKVDSTIGSLNCVWLLFSKVIFVFQLVLEKNPRCLFRLGQDVRISCPHNFPGAVYLKYKQELLFRVLVFAIAIFNPDVRLLELWQKQK